MKILMIAPEPFFQPRGTPISVYFRIQALSELGHRTDLVTYHLGEDKSFPNLRILRIPDLFRVRRIRIGPSWIKIPLDFVLFLKTLWQLTIKRYDMVFSHEEAAFFGTVLAKIFFLPHVYDMHSSLPQQLENFGFTRSSVVRRLFTWMEKYVLKLSSAVIVICLDLLKQVQQEGHAGKVFLLENFLDFEPPKQADQDALRARSELRLNDRKVVLYTGNFQPYQGISLLLEAAARVEDDRVLFLLVGGDKEAVRMMKKKAKAFGIEDRVRFTGQVEPARIPIFIRIADVLVSPRISGTNTPLKIYSHLKSGKPLVATDLWTHTQVLNEKISILVNPDPGSLAKGLSFALAAPEAQIRADRAKRLSEQVYAPERYNERLKTVLIKAMVPASKGH